MQFQDPTLAVLMGCCLHDMTSCISAVPQWGVGVIAGEVGAIAGGVGVIAGVSVVRRTTRTHCREVVPNPI